MAAPLCGASAHAADTPVPYSASGAAYDDDTVIVKYRDGIGASERGPLEEDVGVEGTVGDIAGVDADVVRVQGDPAEVAGRLDRSPKVAYAEPNFILSTRARPNDARFDELWGLHNVRQTGGKRDSDIDAPKGWARAGLRSFPAIGGVRVGVIDTGVDYNHPDLGGKLVGCAESRPFHLRTYCYDDDGHGTHVAGTIAARANNRRGVSGVAFNSPLLVCRALGRTPLLSGPPTGSTADVANCVDWAHRSGARVISMSFDGSKSRTLKRAAERAWSGGGRDGSVLVGAAGNQGSSRERYPAGYRQVISVGATTDRDRLAGFSNRNRDVELTAPGVRILSAYPGGYTRLSGTSMATPHVAGVAAHIWRLHPRDSAERVRRRLSRAVDDLGRNGRDVKYGYGRVNLAKAARR